LIIFSQTPNKALRLMWTFRKRLWKNLGGSWCMETCSDLRDITCSSVLCWELACSCLVSPLFLLVSILYSV